MVEIPTGFITGTLTSVSQYLNTPIGWIGMFLFGIEATFFVIERILNTIRKAKEDAKAYTDQVNAYANGFLQARDKMALAKKSMPVFMEKPKGIAGLFLKSTMAKSTPAQKAVILHQRFTAIQADDNIST